MTLPREIRSHRAARQLTQAALAERARLTPHYISALENGRVPDPYISSVRALADALGVEIDDLVRGSEERPSAFSAPAVDVARQYDAAPAEVRDRTRSASREGGR